MENILVWIFIGPFVYAWQLAGPFVALFITAYIHAVFGFRVWITLLAAFCSSFLYYFVIIPTGGLLGGGMWIIELLMALHTSLLVTFFHWIFAKWKRRSGGANNAEEPRDS
ncbi:MAG: hypothetical protein K0R47_3117 [Brevibacillus sp.]|nr:hypothetical protein [Brevibacillus sp.]